MSKGIIRGVAAAALVAASVAQASAGGINVLSASYGGPSSGAVCNATAAVAAACNGTSACTVNVMNALCGDPDFLVVKQITVAYRCGRQVRQAVSGEYTNLPLSCP